jgi:hypothetical protein
VLLINERRRQRNRPPVDSGDEPLINGANVPSKSIFLPEEQPRYDPLPADPLAPKPDAGAPEPSGGQAGTGTSN